MYDIVIIGAGVVGCGIARELSRYKANICVIEKEDDVCSGTSKANSGIVHAGYDAIPGSLKAKLNVEGNIMMDKLSKELDFPFERNGSLVVCNNVEDINKLEELYERGITNGVQGLEIIDSTKAKEIEPNISDSVVSALYAPSAGIVCPFNLTIALAENASVNGVLFKFNQEVVDIKKDGKEFLIITKKETIRSKYVINAAGVYGDIISHMVSSKDYHITPKKGEYFLLDRNVGDYVTKTIFSLPTKKGKGVLVAPTVHGNLIVGPTATDIKDRDGTNTTRDGLNSIIEHANISVKDVPLKQVITSFVGLRASEEEHEFIIKELEDVEGFINVIGIESPGLTSAPAIGVMVSNMVKDLMKLDKKDNFISTRKGVVNPNTLSMKERNKLIKENPEYGNIVCRCEMVTEGEIIDSIKRSVGARSLDGIKRRVRAGSGRCQGGFCTPRLLEILNREAGIKMTKITKSGGESYILVGHSKDGI